MPAVSAEPRYFDVYRDLDQTGDLELVQRPGDDLTDDEIRALGPEDRAYLLETYGIAVDEDGDVYDARSLDVDSERRAA